MDTLNGGKMEENKPLLFVCIKCDVKCSKKYNFDRHCLTAIHKRIHNDTKKEQIEEDMYICHCGKKYKYSQGLSKHKQKCISVVKPEDVDEPSDKELIIALLKQNAEQNRLNAELIELCKNGITNNNTINNNNNSKTFNLQIYLNETCKDAVNLEEFGKETIIQLSDLDKIGRIGFVDGMTDIIETRFKTLEVNKRPIHCTDAKREVFYVRDNDKWEKDEGNKKMRRLILRTDRKLAPMLLLFGQNHTNLGYLPDSEIIKHQKIVIEILGGKDDDDTNAVAIIRRLSKKMCIEKDNF